MCIFITQFELLDTRHCYAMLFAVRRFELLYPCLMPFLAFYPLVSARRIISVYNQ